MAKFLGTKIVWNFYETLIFLNGSSIITLQTDWPDSKASSCKTEIGRFSQIYNMIIKLKVRLENLNL